MRIVLTAVIMALGCSSVLLAQNTTTINFEDSSGPSTVTSCSSLTVNGVTFTGGQLVTAGRDLIGGTLQVLPDESTVYATRPADGCDNVVYIRFDQAVSSVQVTLVVSGSPFGQAFVFNGPPLLEVLSTGGEFVLNFPASGIATISITGITDPWYFAIDDITFTRAGSNFRLKAAVLKPDDTPAIVERRDLPAGGGNVAQPLQFDLGERVQLSVVQVNPDGTDGAEVPGASFTADARPEDQVPQDPANLFSSPTVLFPGNFLIGFTQAQNQFFAIHSGNPNVTVSFEPPGASSQTSVTVPVEISASGFSLGTSQNDFDNLILEFADLRGIPPQILKSQVQHESGFRADSYRYEPLTVDFASVSMGSNLRVDPRFAPWRLQTFDDSVNPTFPGLPQGDGFAGDPDALALRTRFKVAVFSNNLPVTDLFILPSQGIDLISLPTRKIVPGDPPVSMENILFLNDEVQNWIWDCKAGTNVCTLKPSFRAWFRLRSSESLSSLQPPGLFTGQVVIAASYGLIHPLYTTAVDPMNYTDASGGGVSPSGLFNPETSLDLGSEYDAVKFKDRFTTDPALIDFNVLLADFRRALRDYNPHAKPEAYANPILDDSKKYFPARP